MKMHRQQDESLYTGLSGLQLQIPKYLFPPPYENTSRLTYYSSIFNSIEFNSSFYKIPQSSTVAKWAASVPDTFRFTFKVWKGITHNKGLSFNTEDVTAFITSVNAVKDKKGCLLIQLPPSRSSECIGQLEKLLSCIKETDPTQMWSVAVEFRNTSWYHEHTYSLLHQYGVAVVIQDIPKSTTPNLDHISPFVYLRFHGPTGNYRDSYSDEFIEEYAAYVQEWLEEGKTVYAYFNNTMGEAYTNALLLNDKLRSLKI